MRILAETRGYLGKGALLIKPVAAGAGDTVCRHGALVTINGRIAARARISADPDSFDSRYMGPIDRASVGRLAADRAAL